MRTYNYSLTFSQPASSIMEIIIELYSFIFSILIVISILVSYLLLVIIDNYLLVNSNFFNNNNKIITSEKSVMFKLLNIYILNKTQYLNSKNLLLNNKFLEFLWTTFPCLILLGIAIPSFYYLYISEEGLNTFLTVKAIGSQWFWTYDYMQLNLVSLSAELSSINFDPIDLDDYLIESYKEPLQYLDIKNGASRLLEADVNFLLPINLHLKLIISSTDVLHSFAIPSLGLKVDAVPSRLNQLDVFIHRSGVFFGQCSEICGIGHGFMPISLYAISYLNFLIGTLN